MKNYKLFSFVFILSLILIGSSGIKSANAANCAFGDLFSSVTGQACGITTTTPNGCVSGNLFSTTTGQPCSGNTSINNSAVTQFNNLFKSNFQIGLKGNSDVSALQQFLKDQGYYFGKIDGSYGRITARAVSDFKGDNNLSVAVNTYTPPSTTPPVIYPTNPSSSNLTITTPSQLPNATVGSNYSTTLSIAGGVGGPYTWGNPSGVMPAGITYTYQSQSGQMTIYGVPTTAGTYTFNLLVATDSGSQTTTKQFTLTVDPQ
jgi:peptidoglycan hydrolase-like protein with peptidoglycan-binding domain